MKFFPYIFLLVSTCAAQDTFLTTKVFVMPIVPSLFNWTLQGHTSQYTYRPSLLNAPDLPEWIHYTHSRSNGKGYLYGVPPMKQNDLELEIVGLNKGTYETQCETVLLKVEEKPDPAKYEVQLKIDNLNVEDMFDELRMNRLLDVFRNNLWPQSHADLYVTFLESAVQLGARLPLSPNEREGVVLKLGSQVEFSAALIELQEEVKPLWKLLSCPRDFKRTTVDRFFRDAGFALDWCAFRLVITEELSSLRHLAHHEVGVVDHYNNLIESDTIWSAPSKAEVPQRSYVNEFVATILVPMLIMICLVIILSLILCFHHEGMFDESDEYFESLFDIFEQLLRSKRNKQLPAVQMVQYTAVHRATNTLRSLSNQRDACTVPSEVASYKVQNSSPSNSLLKTTIPRTVGENSCYRPNPPPYSGFPQSTSDHVDF
ncbi:alpha-sarcoglycan isoform X2 [Schistocerca gregaria]|uniref:alpha-sarcoglycan isoform X2 n=1 Tax=Schistocerca gregaria TaxID=7010 RepID=UPI00211DFA19|nr:alpha-sarcoglycan isoform X2 [Schistocerca gregaria]